MKTENDCPHCGEKNPGWSRLPSRDRDRQMTGAVLKLFGKDANRNNVLVCSGCEKPARLRQSTCIWCWEEFEYYAADWKARKRLWCRICERKRSAWNTEKHRGRKELENKTESPEETEDDVRLIMEIAKNEMTSEDRVRWIKAISDGTFEKLTGVGGEEFRRYLEFLEYKDAAIAAGDRWMEVPRPPHLGDPDDPQDPEPRE